MILVNHEISFQKLHLTVTLNYRCFTKNQVFATQNLNLLMQTILTKNLNIAIETLSKNQDNI